MIFLLLEGGRMIWTQQVLQETAFATARCMALRSANCTDPGAMPAWAAARARASGVSIATDAVRVEGDASIGNPLCGDRAGMNSVAISSPFATAVGRLLPGAGRSLTARACFPAAPAT